MYHFFQLFYLRILFWILLVGLLIGVIWGPIIHTAITAIFPLATILYFSLKNNVLVYRVLGHQFAEYPEVILSVKQKRYFDELKKISGVEVVNSSKLRIRYISSKLFFIFLLICIWLTIPLAWNSWV